MQQSHDFKVGDIRIEHGGDFWWFHDVRRGNSDDDIDVIETDLQGISATNLRRVFKRLDKTVGYYSPVRVLLGEPGVDLDYLNPSGVRFVFDGEDLNLSVESYIKVPDDVDSGTNIATLLAPLLKQKGLRLLTLNEDHDDSGFLWFIQVTLGFYPRGRSLRDLYVDALDVMALIGASEGDVSRSTVANLVRGKRVEALLGQPEGRWLEAKRQHYDLGTDHGKIRLAQSVAQFANAVEGGVVIVGLETRKRDGFDVIGRVTPMPQDRGIRRRYAQVLDHRIFPPVDGLSVETIDHADGELILIDVPPQAEEHKPFLVHGVLVDGRVQGNFFSIVGRRNDEMMSTHPASVHAALTVGRALLQRGELPGDKSDIGWSSS